ncbi:nucleoside-diphosphate-sugar epimerase [Vibrio diazotrophicus]|uniref:Nucleoside-diphosphate-sugar epimerase n=1 Tax=Vibrio diazotrophicus TaxID=685 RepID=A0A329DZW4_VIBDI|nr:SDR family oxidoreductase [Vibrio diazotrophicus]RAS52735.1 nucleoside-diphosphate-sugar epimerase [Vibrio diazotrophicus]
MKILVTGSSGFVGSRVIEVVKERGWESVGVVRSSSTHALNSPELFPIQALDAKTDWQGAFDKVDCVVHCAARVHQMQESESDVLEAYRLVNTHGTLHLAEQAAKAGVKRFVFVSSVKVNGERTLPEQPFTTEVLHAPDDPYGLSKYEAELALKALCERTNMELVTIRPPLVYGPGVKANFQSMMGWVAKGLPLPLGAIHNARSLVYIDNLVDLILTSCVHPHASGHTFLVSDGEDVSTTQLLKAVAKAMGKPSTLIPIPMCWIQLAAKAMGKPAVAERLCGNLQVDIEQTQSVLNWSPVVSFHEGITRTAAHFIEARNKEKNRSMS